MTENQKIFTNDAGTDPFDAWLGSALQNSEPYLDDAGFTDQVMAGLPAPARLSDGLVNMLLMTVTVLVSALVIWHLPILGWLFDGLASSKGLSLVHILTTSVGVMFATLAAGIWGLKSDWL